ncbi:MAG: exodeoxyribonuclease V subunit gamma [Clostridium sp.]|nr:exodeoxyribonuclease V subunit gamma [Clostridium sp.]
MLEFVLARSGYGKSEYVFRNIKELIRNHNDNILLITPEQYSFVAERRLLTDLGEDGIRYVENSSFSRISDNVRREFGGNTLPVLSKGAKAVLMMRAIENIKDSLLLFNKRLDALSFVSSMIKICDEMKSCNLSASQIVEMSSNIDNDVLKRKLSDIATIMNAYEMQIASRYNDPADELTRLYQQIKDAGYFKNKYVFIDGFNGFVAQEYKILELIIKEAEKVVITLCTDNPDMEDSFSLFSYVNRSANIIKKIALKADIEISYKTLDLNYRAKNNDIKLAEENIFCDISTSKKTAENIKIYAAKSITDECANTAREIRRLLRAGYRAKDIAIIARNIDTYRDELSAVFKKYDVPFFYDERESIKTQPLVVFIEYLLRCVNYSFRSDDILSLAKTGLTPLCDEELNHLENYIYMWNINGLKWTKEFENSTKGFTSEMNEQDRKNLAGINQARETLITPLLKFKNAVKGASSKEICAQIYYTLINFGADKKIQENAVNLAKLNKHSLAEEQGRVWDLVMEILNQLPITLGEEKIKLKDFAKIFSMVISTEDLGTLPAGIDNVQFGQADRIRTDNPKVVFILGANEGVFPQSVSSGGLLSENDRRILLDNDFKLYSYGEILNLQERYFAYMACSAASESIFVSYLNNSGKDGSPSEIVTSLKSIFAIKEYTSADIRDIDLIETRENSIELMSERYLYNTEFYSSLKEYFKNDSRFKTIQDLVENKDIAIKNKELATSLFSYNMYVSASRVEDFYNCAFRYFCKFGLGARPRVKAEINPMQRGTLIHYVLEMILSTVGSKGLSEMTVAQQIALVDQYTSDYFTNEMGNVSDLSLRFKYNYKRLSKLIYAVVNNLAAEFADCDFEAKAFELTIDKDGQVKPEVLSLDDGGSIQIRGSIDRVDTYENDGKRFVRVVDYKSGSKDFSLSDIMSGLNLQMFIYLFSLCADKTAKLTGTPAGVLYMHASRNMFRFDSKRDAQSNISNEEQSSFKMKGIVLADENGTIPQAMEHELSGKHIPVKMKANGDLTGKLASLEELGIIHKKINQLVAEMGMELHMGHIAQNPIKNNHHKSTCDYCDYKDVCANKRMIDNRIGFDMKDDEVMDKLKKEFIQDAAMDTTTE